MSRKNNNNNQNRPASFTTSDIEAYTKWAERVLREYQHDVQSMSTEWKVFKDANGVDIKFVPCMTIVFKDATQVVRSLSSRYDTTAPITVEGAGGYKDSTT